MGKIITKKIYEKCECENELKRKLNELYEGGYRGCFEIYKVVSIRKGNIEECRSSK